MIQGKQVAANFGNTSVSGTLAQGAALSGTVRDVTTVGNATAPLFAIPVPANSVARFYVAVVGQDGTNGYILETTPGNGVTTIGGFSAVNVTSPAQTSGAPIAPSPLPSWAAGVLHVNVQGPQAVITAASANGGHVRLTTDGQNLLSTSLTGVSLTISGLTVCTEANGVHVATFVNANTFDLVAVPSVHTGADNGLAVETAPPTWTYSAEFSVLFSP